MSDIEIWNLAGQYHNPEHTPTEIHQAYKDLYTKDANLADELAKHATKYSDVGALRALFEAGLTPSYTNKYAQTLLHMVAQADSYYVPPVGAIADCVNFLLDNRVSVLRKDGDGMCCYHYAVHRANLEFIRTLRARDAKLDMTNKFGFTMLHEAAEWFHCSGANSGNNPEIAARFIEMTNELIDIGLDIDAKNDYGRTAGDIVIERKCIPLFKLLVSNPTVFQALDMRAYDHITELASNNPNEVCYEGRFKGQTALGAACVSADTQAVQLLLAAGADVNAKNDAGENALVYLLKTNNPSYDALKEKHLSKMLDLFAANGWDKNSAIDANGNNLLIAACKKNFGSSSYNNMSLESEIMDWLLNNGADVTMANAAGETALMFASISNNDKMENVLISLLENGADINARDATGKTALHYAAMNHSQSRARGCGDLLFAFGKVDTSTVDNNGKTALDTATEHNNEELVKYLLSKV